VLSAPEREELRSGGALPRVCLACEGPYTLVAVPCTVPGYRIDKFPEEPWPLDEHGRKVKGRIPRNMRTLNAWVSGIRPKLQSMREQGLTIEEIAEKLQKPVKKVRSWLSRAGLLKTKKGKSKNV
jgi:hypothetical protein